MRGGPESCRAMSWRGVAWRDWMVSELERGWRWTLCCFQEHRWSLFVASEKENRMFTSILNS